MDKVGHVEDIEGGDVFCAFFLIDVTAFDFRALWEMLTWQIREEIFPFEGSVFCTLATETKGKMVI